MATEAPDDASIDSKCCEKLNVSSAPSAPSPRGVVWGMNTPSPFDPEPIARASDILEFFKAKKLMLATAESCTGGLVAGLLTEIAGSSSVVERGFVTYTNEAKIELIDVPRELIENFGAVSQQVARAMATGALKRSRADIAVAITGVAGPGGGSPDKPVGFVHVACARRGRETTHRECRFPDTGRAGVRRAAILVALDMLGARAMEG